MTFTKLPNAQNWPFLSGMDCTFVWGILSLLVVGLSAALAEFGRV